MGQRGKGRFSALWLAFASGAVVAQAAETAPSVGRIWAPTAAPAREAAAAPTVTRAVPAVFDRGMLVDLRGFTLYWFEGDRRPNVSTCYGVCQTLWPPHYAQPGATSSDADFTVISRRDGSMQWAWRGKPLYRWARDRKPGDLTGDNVNKVWHRVTDEN